MTRVVALRCNNCGAGLEVPDRVRFVTCQHCQTSLEIRREGGAAFTEVAERLDRVEGRLDRVQTEQELARLDREWEAEKKELMIETRGGPAVPTMGAAVAVGVIAGGGGLALTLLAETGMFIAFGIGLIGLGLAGAVYLGSRAEAYGEALRRYERRRAELEARLSG